MGHVQGQHPGIDCCPPVNEFDDTSRYRSWAALIKLCVDMRQTYMFPENMTTDNLFC
jgi:hypothetical protein